MPESNSFNIDEDKSVNLLEEEEFNADYGQNGEKLGGSRSRMSFGTVSMMETAHD